MDLAGTLSYNMQRLLKAYDISARALAERANLPQKTVHNVLVSKHNCRLDTLEQISKTFFISPSTMITPNLPLNVLMSRRLNRMVEGYTKMTPEQRDQLDEIIQGMIGSEAPETP